MKIKEYFYERQGIILILLAIGVTFLVIKDVPFLNIIFPNYATISSIFVAASFLLSWYKKGIFYILLVIITGFSYFSGSISQTEQLAILIFVMLTINITVQAVDLFKDAK